MELRHQHRNERDVAGEEKTRREPELEQQHWPGKRTLTQSADHAEVDARTPDLRRIRSALGSLRSGGQALPGQMTAHYSQLLGLDLSDVRIHRGGAAGKAAKNLEATAFTAGTNIAIADHLDLDSAFGRHVIAHELVHVAQNKRSGAPMDFAARMEVGPSGSAVEQEAERGAAALVRGEAFTVQAHGRLPGISRYAGDETPPPGATAPVTLPNQTPAPTRPDNTPTPTTQPTQAQPAAPPTTPAPPATAAPTAQPRPTDQPGNTPQSPATPAPGTPGYNQASGSAPPTNPTALPNRERPGPAPQPAPAPTPAMSLDARVQQELETRADPTLKAGYARAVAGVDSLRIQALQYSFTPNGIWNTLIETFTARNAFQDHFGQIYSANAYRGGNSWADTAQAWIEGLRGVVHIIGDVASVISAWAGLAALVTGALALILSETVIGGIALGAIAAIAAEVALVAGAIKLLTDIIDLLLGVIQMIILIVRARNSKDPAQRARFAALLRKESSDFGANVVGIGVQVAVMAVTAGIGAGLSRGANSFMSAFKDEFSKMITPALKPWTLGTNFRNIARMATPVAVGTGVRAGRTVLQVEVDQGLVGINRQARVGNRITRTREVIPFTARNQMNGARLVTMRNAVGRAVIVNGAGVAVGLGAGQLQADIKQPRAERGGTSGSSPSANGGRLNAPSQPAGADLSKVSMWPSQIEAFQNAKAPLGGAVDRTQRQYDMAETQAGPELGAQVRQAFQGANNQAGQMRFGAMQVQTDAREGQANTQRGLQQTAQGRDQQTRMGTTQDSANRNVQRIQGQGTRLQSPPPKEGVLGWLYNQTIGRIGGWIGSAQRWVTNLVGKWAMSLAGFSKEEMDIAGIENDMREDDKKDQTSTQEAQDAALRADQIQQTVFTLQENKTRDEQYAIQAMADSQRFIQALEDADRQIGAAITNGQSYIAAVTPVIAHELQTEAAGAAIDAQYVAPLVAYATSFTDSIDASNIGSSARTDGNGALARMKAAYPELDIGPGTTAIGNAAAQYDTAFGTLAGQARGQVAAMQTAVQAFIGTQDYDGVGGNATALDALAADFDAAAQRLADQLYASINSTITQYNGHIQRAIDEANQTPDTPAADPATPNTPVDEPMSSDDPASGFGTGVASIERPGVAPNPAAMSETKAPVADNAAKPATSDAAQAEKAATPPDAPTAAPEKADAAGTKPAANDGTPAKDDVAKAGAVDKPRGEEAKQPATAKPFGTPKDNAKQGEADKTDSDKVDLGAAPPKADAGGGESGSEAGAAPKPKTGTRAASTKPQETPLEEPVTTAAPATASAAAPAAKPKAERKAPSKKTKAGGGSSASAGASEVEPAGEEEEAEVNTEGEATGRAEGEEEAEGAEREDHDSYATEPEEEGDGYATGEGQPGTATPTQSAAGATTAAEVTHTTEATAAGAADDRTTVGVGEKVTFESTEAGAWSATSVGPGGVATKRSSNNYEWVAPATAGSSTITVTPAGGTAKSIDMTVIAPSTIDFESPQEQSYPNGTQGAGMITNVRYKPTTVSFYRTQWKEIGGPASGASGYFAGRRLPNHRPNPNWLQIGDDNGGPTDNASFYGFPSPWSAGTFQWVIPNRYLVNGATGAGTEFAQITQSCTLESDGTTTITKGSASVTRAPGAAPARGGRGAGGGYATGEGHDSAEAEGFGTGWPGMGARRAATTDRDKRLAARRKLSGIVRRLATSNVSWDEINNAHGEATAAYSSMKAAGLEPYVQTIRKLAQLRTETKNDAHWQALVRGYKTWLADASAFMEPAEKRAIQASYNAIVKKYEERHAPTVENNAARAETFKKPKKQPDAGMFGDGIPKLPTNDVGIGVVPPTQNRQRPPKSPPPQIIPAVKKPRPKPESILSTIKPAKPGELDWLINPSGAEYSTGGFPTASKKPLARETTPKPKPTLQLLPTPELDRWIDTLEIIITAIPGSGLKAPLETTKATLEILRIKEQKGEPHNNAKLVFTLGEGVIGTIAQIAKLFGRNAALAGQAAEQLGKFAGVLGVIGKVASAPEILSRAVDGKTLSGTPIDTNARWDAWVDLVGLIPIIGTAVTLTKTAFMNIVNGIGVPVKENITAFGVKRLFPGTTPEKLKAEILAMTTEPQYAYGTINKLEFETFKPVTVLSQALVSDLWRTYLLESLKHYGNEYKEIKTRKADDIVRQRMAEHFKETAIRFIDKQVREANKWDGTLIQR